MVSKNNIEMKYKKMRDEKQRFSIRKFSVGAASVLIGLSFSLYNGQQASADTVDNGNKSVVANAQDKEQTDSNQPADTNTHNNEDKTNNNQARSTVTDNLGHSTVVASYKADTTNKASEANNSSENTESKSDEKQAVTTETAKTEEAATKEVEAKNTTNDDVAKKTEEAAAKTDTKVDVNKAVVENVKTEATTPSVETKNTETQTAKTDEEKVETAVDNTSSDLKNAVENATTEVSTNTFNVNEAVLNVSFLSTRAATESKVATRVLAAEPEDPNAVTVNDAKGFINAIKNGTATTINVARDLNLAEQTDRKYTEITIKNKRDIVIQSDNPEEKRTIDFSGYSFDMDTQNSVTFKDLNIYARSYWGLVYNAGGYTFDNVNFTGSQLIYTKPWINSTLTFKNNITANSVSSYVGPLDGKTRDTQQNGGQQILQFEGGTNQIIFDENSNVTLTTEDANALEIDDGTTTIEAKNGANVTINPHSKGNPENRNGIGTGSIARAIASNANTTINVDKGANLTINTEKASGDSDVAGALYLNSDAKFNVNGNLNINSNGTPSTKNNGYPVYIAGNAAINVGNGGKFNLSATNTGSYSDNLMSISGKGTVKLAPHSNFKISADGTGALTAINLSSGSTFTSDQPDVFTIDLSQNTSTGKSLIKNGTINFSRVKTVATDGTTSEPLGKIDVTYDRVTTYTITSLNEDTVKQVGEGLANKNLIDFVKAGEDVTLSNLHLSKDNVLTGTVASSGSDNPIYVTVTVGGVSTNIPVLNYYTVYTNTNGTVTSNNVDYAAQTASTGGDFSIDLSKLASSLTNDAQVAVTATKDFVEAAQTKSVAALRALNTTTLKELVDAAPAEEAKPSYYNATAEAQGAYTKAITAGKNILDNPNNYDQVDVDNAVTAIQNAQKALTGEPTNKTELQDAINQASTVESSDNYTNADSNLQKAYTDAISAGQKVLSNDNATQTEVDNALTTINNAKDALNGDAKKAASKEALQKAVDEAPTVKSDDAAYYNGSAEAKTAYDNAITAGQTVLDNPDATATQITDALNAINTAKGNLKGEATDKAALQTAVDNSATVKESNNYTNADQTQKTAYDKAVTAAQTVLDKTNATQAEVNQALQDLEIANRNLNGDAKTEAANKAALEAAVKDAPNVRNTPAYYNGSEETQTAYNNAITAGQTVLNEANPSASEVKNALDAINAAKDNLKGKATNTEALETALTNANNAKETGNYTNADQANQEALNNAIIAGQEILKNTSATQAQVDSAAKAITDAISGLNGDTNLANAKTAATEDIQKALDTKTTEITDATNIDQATKDQLIADAKKAAEDANTAINQSTDTDTVNTAKTEGIANINKVTVPSLADAKTKAAKEIDQALTDKTKEINNAENIDQTTKDQLIKEATDAANTAKDAIEKSTTNDEATKAGQAGVDAITNVKVPSVTDSQNAAKEVIDDALNAKTKEINDANNIDQTTKDQLIKEATDAANKAKEAIDKATTADAIKTAQDEGTTNINNVTVPSLEDAKKAANKAVDDALTAQTEVINKANNLSDAEKKDLIDQVTAEANKAKENIETATTNNEAAQAGQAGVDAIKKIVPTSLDTVKSDANKAIDDALTKKLEEINSANDLTTDEKTALTQEANTAADKAKEEITNATTNDAVIEAQNNGVTAIDGIKVPTESAVKEAAKQAVADAATAKNQAIDASNLTDEEKAALKQKVTDAQNAADQAIDNATTNAAVTEAQTNGIKAINGIEVTTSTVKEAAKKAVADAATAKNNAIDASNLTDEEKAALKQKVTDAQNAADQAIDNATTNVAVTEAQTNGVNAINGIEVPTTSATKEHAITDLNAAVDDAKKAIDQDSNLTDEEKQAAKDQIDRDATKAQEAINNAKTNDDVKKAGDAGTLAIDKDVANAAIDNAVAGKKAEISKTPLTDEEKTALNNEVDQKAQEAKEAINNATTPEAVTTAQDSGVNNINETSVPSESAAKQAAKEAVAKAVDEKNAAIDSSNLTEEEKEALKQKVTEAQTAADQAIDNATTNAGVTEAQTNGVNAINGIEVPNKSDAKEQAITDLNTAVDNAKKAIDQDSNLTDEEKQAAKDQIDADAKNAQDAINNAKTNDDVKKAAYDGTLAIDKDVANAAIDNAVAGKKAEISNSSLTDEEKTALNNEVDQKANSAKDAINNATTPEAVTTAQGNGIKNINATSVPTTSTAKEAAKKAVAEAAEAKNSAIDSSNLTDEEKAALKQKVTEAQNAADRAIDAATTNTAVTEAQDKGVKAIDNVTVPTESAAKEAAKKAVAEAAEAKNNAIDSSNLTAEEKAALKQEVTEAQNAADRAIDAATTNTAVTEAQDKGVKAIDNVTVPTESAAKEAAKKAVAEVAEAKNNAIDSSNLTAEEKAALKQEVAEAQNAANTTIDNATTNAAVTEAEDNGIKAINSIEVPTKSDAKEQATSALNTAVDEAKKAIDQDSNLTDEEKQAAKDQIDSDAKKAQEAIDNAKTNDDVKKTIDDGTLAIDKDVANAAIANAVAGKKAEISKSPLTAEEKTALNNEVDQKAQDAKESINNATTPEAVTTAQENGIQNINNTEVPTESAAKEAAKKAVAEAADAKNNAIDSSNLTAEEKAALKQEVSDAQSAADQAIDNATTNAAVTEAQNNGIDKINSIKVSDKSAAKEQATTDLNNQVDEAKKAIDQDNNLTDEEKQAAKDQIDSDAKKAQDAIDNAKTNDDVKKAVDDGKLVIDKDVANAAIDNAVAGKLKEINDSLTNEEKQAYTDLINNEADNAKQKIAEATTPEEVTRAQEEGVKDINNINVPTTSPAKDVANAAIDQALKNKEDEINNATNISSEEKADLIKQATEAATTAKDNINNATTNSEVETAQVDGEKAIADVTVPGLSDIKKESIDLINKALNEKQDEINNASNLSQDEKQELIDQAKKVATEAIDEINNAQTNNEAKQAADTGVKNIENVSIPSIEDAKKNATQAIDDALNSKKNEINNASNLPDSEKTDLINQATEIANAAKDAINSATTNTAVETAEDKGVADINNIHFTNLEDSKNAANSAIEDALNTKKDEINNASNLSDSEKAKLINQATEIAKVAKDAINNATTNTAVTAAENKGIEDIANVNVPSLSETKQAAIDAIKQVQKAKNSQIEEAKNLSADEQKNLIDQVNKIAQDAINKLNDSATTTNEVITDTRDKAIDKITNLFIPTLDSVQKDAQEAINSAKEAKIEEINKADNLTDQMRQNLIDQVDQVADKATKAINNAQTNDDVKEAEIKGLEDIDSIKVPSLVESKDDAIKEINDALKKKTDEINAADLDQKQKDELISQITDIATETKTKVFNATTNAEVDAEAEAGIKAIEAVKIPARTANNSNTESHDSSTNVTPDHHNEENNTAQNTNQVSTNTESESKEQTVITNSVQPKRNAVRHKNGSPVNKKATLPQTGKKDNSNLTLAGAALLGLAGVFSLFGLGDKRKKNK